MLNIFDGWHIYLVDEQTGEPAGVGPLVKEGQLEFPITINQWERFIFRAYLDYCVGRYGQCPAYFNPCSATLVRSSTTWTGIP